MQSSYIATGCVTTLYTIFDTDCQFWRICASGNISKAGLQFSGAAENDVVSIYNLSNAIFCTDRKKMHF